MVEGTRLYLKCSFFCYNGCGDGMKEKNYNGFDIYAAQSFFNEKGRRIFIGWMWLPYIDYTISTVKNTIFELRISKIQNKFSLKLRSDFTLENENSLLMKVGYGRKQIHLKVDHLEDIVIFSEWSSLECD